MYFTKNDLISIIIISYNTKALLKQCIESFKKNEDIPFEIIVVDNASKDGSVDMVRRNYPDIKIIENSANIGFAKANNIGIRMSEGNYICLANSDTIVKNDTLISLYNRMKDNKDVGIIGPKLLNIDGTLQLSCKSFPSLWIFTKKALFLHRLFPKSLFWSEEEMPESSHNAESYVDAIAGAFLFVRKKAIDSVGLLDDRFFFYGEDIDWCKRFKLSGWRVMYSPNVAIFHIGGASSINNPIKFYTLLRKAKCYYLDKHFSKVNRIFTHFIFIFDNVIRILLSLALFPFNKEKSRFMFHTNFIQMIWTIKFAIKKHV